MFNVRLTATSATRNKFLDKVGDTVSCNEHNLEYRTNQLWMYVMQMTRHAFLLGQKYPDITADEMEELSGEFSEEEEEDKE